jgi:hypothetical protein
MIRLISLNSQLSTLKFACHEALMKGNSFEEVKKIYLRIKEIQKLILDRELSLLKGDTSS